MKKKSAFLAVLVMLVAITSYSVSGTYAKYTSQFTGTSTARVAKWAFSLNSATLSDSTAFTFNLFDTILDSDGSSTEANVASSNADKVIAPGTSGKFEFALANNSEVDANYAIAFTTTNADNIPIEFSIDGNHWETSIANINVGDTQINKNGGTATKTVYWRWVYTTGDANDVTDTSLGKAGTATVVVNATITATQID